MPLPGSRPALLALALLATLGLSRASAQSVDLQRVVPPLEASPRTLADYLVQQAWANAPLRRELETQIERGSERVTLARRSWMDQTNFNVNFASQRQTFDAFNQQYLFPGFNFGVAMPLGTITNNKGRVRVAETEAVLAKARLDRELPGVREDVMLALENIETARELLRIRRRAEVDAETNNNLVQSLYEQGKAQFEDVAQASEVYYQSSAATVTARSNLDRAQIRLQTLTGLTQAQIETARRRFAVQ